MPTDAPQRTPHARRAYKQLAENNMRSKGIEVIVLVAALAAGITACEKKGPVEQAAEEIDEAIDTAKNGGKEPVADKVDDAVDELRE
jgi:predicted small lipoprotein YifL